MNTIMHQSIPTKVSPGSETLMEVLANHQFVELGSDILKEVTMLGSMIRIADLVINGKENKVATLYAKRGKKQRAINYDAGLLLAYDGFLVNCIDILEAFDLREKLALAAPACEGLPS